jgi:hypothetical protein
VSLNPTIAAVKLYVACISLFVYFAVRLLVRMKNGSE